MKGKLCFAIILLKKNNVYVLVARENPCKHGVNMQSPHRKAREVLYNPNHRTMRKPQVYNASQGKFLTSEIHIVKTTFLIRVIVTHPHFHCWLDCTCSRTAVLGCSPTRGSWNGKQQTARHPPPHRHPEFCTRGLELAMRRDLSSTHQLADAFWCSGVHKPDLEKLFRQYDETLDIHTHNHT